MPVNGNVNTNNVCLFVVDPADPSDMWPDCAELLGPHLGAWLPAGPTGATVIARFASEVSASAIVAKVGAICMWQDIT